MKITFITLFPEYFESFKSHSIIKNALNKKLIQINCINPRDFAAKNQVDDYIYGGGSGMLLMIEPIVEALKSINSNKTKVILLGPKGQRYSQPKAKVLSKEKDIVFICGHYEGIDARIQHYIDEEISIGDFIITGGELASAVVAYSIIRLIPGVIKAESHENESFENNTLECDHFTKPRTYDGHSVPKVLLNGNHKKIENWRKNSTINNTLKNLLEKGKNNGN